MFSIVTESGVGTARLADREAQGGRREDQSGRRRRVEVEVEDRLEPLSRLALDPEPDAVGPPLGRCSADVDVADGPLHQQPGVLRQVAAVAVRVEEVLALALAEHVVDVDRALAEPLPVEVLADELESVEVEEVEVELLVDPRHGLDPQRRVHRFVRDRGARELRDERVRAVLQPAALGQGADQVHRRRVDVAREDEDRAFARWVVADAVREVEQQVEQPDEVELVVIEIPALAEVGLEQQRAVDVVLEHLGHAISDGAEHRGVVGPPMPGKGAGIPSAPRPSPISSPRSAARGDERLLGELVDDLADDLGRQQRERDGGDEEDQVRGSRVRVACPRPQVVELALPEDRRPLAALRAPVHHEERRWSAPERVVERRGSRSRSARARAGRSDRRAARRRPCSRRRRRCRSRRRRRGRRGSCRSASSAARCGSAGAPTAGGSGAGSGRSRCRPATCPRCRRRRSGRRSAAAAPSRRGRRDAARARGCAPPRGSDRRACR